MQRDKSIIMSDWNDKVKRLLKSELVRRGISNSDLANMLEQIGIEETKSSIDSKISRGSFSAAFFLQCLTVIGCEKIEIEEYESQLAIAAEPQADHPRGHGRQIQHRQNRTDDQQIHDGNCGLSGGKIKSTWNNTHLLWQMGVHKRWSIRAMHCKSRNLK